MYAKHAQIREDHNPETFQEEALPEGVRRAEPHRKSPQEVRLGGGRWERTESVHFLPLMTDSTLKEIAAVITWVGAWVGLLGRYPKLISEPLSSTSTHFFRAQTRA